MKLAKKETSSRPKKSRRLRSDRSGRVLENFNRRQARRRRILEAAAQQRLQRIANGKTKAIREKAQKAHDRIARKRTQRQQFKRLSPKQRALSREKGLRQFGKLHLDKSGEDG